MTEENKHFYQRTVTLKHTKRRLTEDEVEKYKKEGKIKEDFSTMTQEPPPSNCGNWYLVWYQQYQAWFSCRICYQGYPTAWPYEECVQMPE